MSCSKALVATALLALAACQSTPEDQRIAPQAGSLDAGFGEVTKHNAAVQVIDPDPVHTADGAQPGDSGAKASAAARRYRTDQVKDTKPVSTTASSSGGGSGPR